jgi:hypothetical protein
VTVSLKIILTFIVFRQIMEFKNIYARHLKNYCI